MRKTVNTRVAHNTASDRVKCPRIVPTQITMRSVNDVWPVSCSMSDCVIRDFDGCAVEQNGNVASRN